MKMIALLRGINVGGKRKISMPELRSVISKIGYTQVETYINSGNLIFHTKDLDSSDVAALLESAILKHFGFPVDVIVRTASEWGNYASRNPFADAAAARPNFLHLGLSKLPCNPNAASLLSERVNEFERITIVNDAIWVDFGIGPGKSKLTPAIFEKAVGSPVTLRNWRTVQKINEILNI